MTTAFQDLLKQKSDALSKRMNQNKKPEEPLECTVTVVDIKNPAELHVWFNRYPGPNIIADLKAAGFKWNASVWWALDSESKRAFCRARLNARELEPYTPQPTVTATPPEPAPQLIVVPDPEPELDDSAFGIYKRQVRELIEHLKIDVADLQLLAIDKLHKSTFGQN